MIFVGLNDNTIYGKNTKLYFHLNSQHNYYTEINDMTIVNAKVYTLVSGFTE
jgi:hypothetical protein